MFFIVCALVFINWSIGESYITMWGKSIKDSLWKTGNEKKDEPNSARGEGGGDKKKNQTMRIPKSLA